MYGYFQTGFSDSKVILITSFIYLVMLGIPLAITFVAVGFKDSFPKQLKLTIVAFIILIAGGLLVYGPALSYIAAAFAILNFGFSVHAAITRRKIESSL